MKRTKRTRVAKEVKTNSPASGATAVTTTIAADANRVVANLARKPRRPRQEVTHLQRKRPLPRPSRVGLSRKHLPTGTYHLLPSSGFFVNKKKHQTRSEQ